MRSFLGKHEESMATIWRHRLSGAKAVFHRRDSTGDQAVQQTSRHPGKVLVSAGTDVQHSWVRSSFVLNLAHLERLPKELMSLQSIYMSSR
jgi:hypothetical protein